MHRESLIQTSARLCIVIATLIWGSAFVVLKNTISDLPIFYLLAIRFLAAAALLSVIFLPKWKQMNKGYLIRGMVMGLFLFLAFATQTFGLLDTTPSVNAFLTTVYCVIVPFLYWFVSKKRPDQFHLVAALLCIAGVGFVSFGGAGAGALAFRGGELLTLVSGFFFAAHMVAISLSTKGRDVFLLTTIQFATAGTLALVCGLCFETFPTAWNSSMVFSLGYLTIFCTAVTLLLQALGQKYTEPSESSVLLSLESVFAMVFSMIFYGDRPTLPLFIGFGLIFFSVICSETKLSFLRRRRRKRVKTSAYVPAVGEAAGAEAHPAPLK